MPNPTPAKRQAQDLVFKTRHPHHFLPDRPSDAADYRFPYIRTRAGGSSGTKGSPPAQAFGQSPLLPFFPRRNRRGYVLLPSRSRIGYDAVSRSATIPPHGVIRLTRAATTYGTVRRRLVLSERGKKGGYAWKSERRLDRFCCPPRSSRWRAMGQRPRPMTCDWMNVSRDVIVAVRPHGERTPRWNRHGSLNASLRMHPSPAEAADHTRPTRRRQ
jgi:hypothetical protein